MLGLSRERLSDDGPNASDDVRPRRRRTDFEANPGWRRAGIIAATVAVTDWTTKALVASVIPLESIRVVWGGRLAFWHVRNPALILGLFGDLSLTSRKV